MMAVAINEGTAIVAKKFGIFVFKAGIVLSVLYMLGWTYAHSNPQEYYGIIPFSEALTIASVPAIIGTVLGAIFTA